MATVGTTRSRRSRRQYHVEPTTPRTFDIELAKSKLEAAGYVLDANNARLDKEGNPLNLRLFMPDSEDTYPAAAQFIQDWLGELGIDVSTEVFDSQTLTDIMLPPEAGDYTADYDLFIWGWGGDVDPNSLLDIFTCDADRQLERLPVLQSRVRRAVRAAERRRDDGGAQGDRRRDAEHLL